MARRRTVDGPRPSRGHRRALRVRRRVATIAVPDRQSTGAAELVVLHEVAHHLCRCEPPHGPDFVAAFCELAETVMGPEVGHVLRVTYAKEGVR